MWSVPADSMDTNLFAKLLLFQGTMVVRCRSWQVRPYTPFPHEYTSPETITNISKNFL